MAVLQALGVTDLQLSTDHGRVPAQLNDSAKAAERRMQKRARVVGVDLAPLVLTGDIQQWEQLITVSFQQGMSLHLEESSSRRADMLVGAVAHNLHQHAVQHLACQCVCQHWTGCTIRLSTQ